MVSLKSLSAKHKLIIGLVILVIFGLGVVLSLATGNKPTKASTALSAHQTLGAKTESSAGSAAAAAGTTAASPSTTKTTTSTSTTTGSGASGSSSPPSSSSPAPSLPPPAYADNFSGIWYTNFGSMVITQNGTHATGTYSNGPTASNGTIDGTVNAQTLTGTWSINGATGSLSLVKGTHTVDGSYNSSFKWCGALKGYQFPADCGFAGHWVTNLLSTGNSCAMDLTRINNIVTGTYCNGSINGTISYPVGATKLTGSWKIGSLTGPFSFFLAGLGTSPHQLYFQGNYNQSGQTNNYWCGGNTAAAQPATCLKT